MEENSHKTVLSAGILVKGLLTSCKDLEGVSVYPVIAPAEGSMPAIVYRRADLASVVVKEGIPADTTYIEMEIWTDDYEEGISIAETVRSIFDCRQTPAPWKGLMMRSCVLDNSNENGTEDGLFVQYLRFRMKV